MNKMICEYNGCYSIAKVINNNKELDTNTVVDK